MKAIVYTSNTDFTARYAKMPGEKNGTLLEDVRKTNRLGDLPLFTVQGGMDYSKLKGINRFMINTLIKVMSGQKNPSEDDKKKLALIREGGDYVREENLAQVLAWMEVQQ